MGLFIASPPIERRHTRQRIAEEPSRQIARLKLGSAITIRQRQGTGPNARREHEVSGLAAASSFVQDFGHCSFPPYGLPKPQPYGTPVPWPNGDGRLSESGPNTGISMKTRTLGVNCDRGGRSDAMVHVRFARWSQRVDATLWDRWQRGESLKAIGRAFGKSSSSIYFQLAPHGGIRPPPRRRSRLALTLAEREEISRTIALDQSARSIARLLGRSPSSVSREISRNGGYDRYRAAPADEQAWNRARRPKRCKLATNSRLRRSVAERLRLNWSPEQIAGWLKRTYPEDESCQVSHETRARTASP
jgi:DNA-binding CsgD family transcriptional regulator